MRKFSFIIIALVLFFCFGQALAQKRKKVSKPKKTETVITSPDVEIKEDKFSGNREVRLAAQRIASFLTLELEESIDLDAPAKTAQQWYIGVKFTFDYGNVNFLKGEFNFIVDGKRVKGSELSYSSGGLSDQLSKREFFIGVISVRNLEIIANGSEVQMKIGDKVYDIDESVRKNIKVFVAALKRK